MTCWFLYQENEHVMIVMGVSENGVFSPIAILNHFGDKPLDFWTFEARGR
jgi:hypothetical protein